MKKAAILASLALLSLGAQSAMAQSYAPVYTGNVQADVAPVQPAFWGDVETKTLVMEPGRGQFTLDKVGMGDTVQLTLVNTSNLPMRFETTQRLGREHEWVVPAHSSKIVSYRFNNPLNDEVKFMVSADPTAALALQAQQMTAPVATNYTTTTTRTSETFVQPAPVVAPAPFEPAPVATERTVTESRATVRGFW